MIAATYGSTLNDVVVMLTSILTLLTQLGIIGVVGLKLASKASASAAGVYGSVAARVAPAAVPLAFVVAAFAMANSLYFSLKIGWLPCVMCWYQRTAIYPLAVILGIAAFLRKTTVAPYALGLAAIGACLSAYHYLIEWFPTLEGNVCNPAVPCTEVYFRSFGYISISLMALTCALAVITLLLLLRDGHRHEQH